MGYETLKNIIEFNRAQPSIEEEALAKDECPECAYPLKVNPRGQKACPICERIYE